MILLLWRLTRGYRLRPWKSPYLRWRLETYTGIRMNRIGFIEFWGFTWRERMQILRFLRWTGQMGKYARVKPQNP